MLPGRKNVSNLTKPGGCSGIRNQVGFEVLPKRWIVERTLAWLGINRRLAKDFERFSTTSLAFIQTAMIKLMTRRLVFTHP